MAASGRHLATLGVDSVLFDHDAVSARLGDVVDVEVPVRARQHQPGLPAQASDGHDVWQPRGGDCHGGEGTRLVQGVRNLKIII